MFGILEKSENYLMFYLNCVDKIVLHTHCSERKVYKIFNENRYSTENMVVAGGKFTRPKVLGVGQNLFDFKRRV